MNILFIGPLPEPTTGQSLACKVLADGLRECHQVDIVDLKKKEFTQGISSSSRVGEILRVLWHVFRKRRAADAVYLTVSESIAGNLRDVAIYVLCFRQLSQMVIHLHGGAGMRRIMHGDRRFLRGLNIFFLKRLGATVVLGKSHLALYRGVVEDAKLHIVPNFAEDVLFATAEVIEAKFQQPSPLRLLFLSNLLPGKGHEELIEAYMGLDAHIRARIRLDLAGGFETDRQRSEFLSRVAGVEQIHYHGIVTGERKRCLFEQAHVFCLPTYYPHEGQPISILEAYASGCAVITTDHSGIPDVFRDGVNGYEVSQRSVSDLRAVIVKSMEDCARLREMAVLNMKTAQVTYRASRFQREVMQVIDSVARAQ